MQLEAGDELTDRGSDALGVEAHGRDVEGIAVHQSAGVRLHQLHAGTQGIGHVHHIHVGTGLERAGKLTLTHGSVVDVYGVVRRATPWRRYIGDQPWEAYRARIDAEALVVVVAEQLA